MSIHPVFSRRYTRRERGPVVIHPVSIHPMFPVWGAGMKMGYHAHPSHFHPSPVVQEGCWDEDGVPHLRVPCFQGRTLGMTQVIPSTHPKVSRTILRWSGSPTSSTPAPFRRDACRETGSHVAQAGRWDGDRLPHPPIPRHQRRAVGWRQDPPSALGNPTLVRDIPNCRGAGVASCFLAASSPLRVAQRGAEFRRRGRLSSLASGQGSAGLGEIPLQHPWPGGDTMGPGTPGGGNLPTAPMGAGPCGLRSLLASSSWRLRHTKLRAGSCL